MNRQKDTETIADLFVAEYLNCSPMNSYQILYQRQAYSRTYCIVLPVIPLIKTLKQSIHRFLRHQFSGIGYIHLQGMFVRQPRFHGYPSVFGCIFGGIRQEIVNNLIQLIGIEETGNLLRRAFKGKDLTPLSKQRDKNFCTTAQERRDITVGNTDFEVAAFYFPEFQYLLYQTHQAGSIGSHYRMQRTLVASAFQILQRSKNYA